jgi:SMI1-KNR4 cell-wall
MDDFFQDFDFANFWDESEYAQKEYPNTPLNPEIISNVEQKIGYKLPLSYLAFMRFRNGGIPKKNSFAINNNPEHVAQVEDFFGIGDQAWTSLCGTLGHTYMIEECLYPPIGVYIGTSYGGHVLVVLDYSEMTNGEPCVVIIDTECDDRRTFLAPNFETFVRGLRDEEGIDELFHTVEFSPQFSQLLALEKTIRLETVFRNWLPKMEFADLNLFYGIIFHLLALKYRIYSKNDFVKYCLELRIFVTSRAEHHFLQTRFLADWFEQKTASGAICKGFLGIGGFKLSVAYKKDLFQVLGKLTQKNEPF